jgi:hypothetical protein
MERAGLGIVLSASPKTALVVHLPTYPLIHFLCVSASLR